MNTAYESGLVLMVGEGWVSNCVEVSSLDGLGTPHLIVFDHCI